MRLKKLAECITLLQKPQPLPAHCFITSLTEMSWLLGLCMDPNDSLESEMASSEDFIFNWCSTFWEQVDQVHQKRITHESNNVLGVLTPSCQHPQQRSMQINTGKCELSRCRWSAHEFILTLQNCLLAAACLSNGAVLSCSRVQGSYKIRRSPHCFHEEYLTKIIKSQVAMTESSQNPGRYLYSHLCAPLLLNPGPILFGLLCPRCSVSSVNRCLWEKHLECTSWPWHKNNKFLKNSK